MSVDIQDIITCATSCDDRLRGLGVARGRISRYPIDLRRRPYNTLALPCECVMTCGDVAPASPTFGGPLPTPKWFYPETISVTVVGSSDCSVWVNHARRTRPNRACPSVSNFLDLHTRTQYEKQPNFAW